MRFIFVGGMAPEYMYAKERSASRSPLQNSAENFQQTMVTALSTECDNVDVITAPFFAGWPFGHNFICINKKKFQKNNIAIHGVSYTNIPIIKNFHKFFNIRHELIEKVENSPAGAIVVAYSLNLAYAAAVASLRYQFENVTLGVIVTDLPEHPGDCGMLYRSYLKWVEAPLLRLIKDRFDFYVVLTDKMPDAIGVNKNKCIVMEGLYVSSIESNEVTSIEALTSGRQIILYTGTLDYRYGIPRLIQEFQSIADESLELWVCGAGSAENIVRDAAAASKNIKYLGSKPRKEILSLQRRADLLVNPRDNFGEYNKYSFPSKMIEYMASGAPTLIYALDGIPEDYYQHVYTVNVDSGESLASAICRVLRIPRENRVKKGLGAQRFILEEKSATHQVGRILRFARKFTDRQRHQ